jgi:hypothetical protein
LLLRHDWGCAPRSGRDEVHDEIVDARLGERNGCDDKGGEGDRDSISRAESDCADDTDGGADDMDDIFSQQQN